MYKQHLQDTKDVERQVEEVVRDMGSIIDTLCSQLVHIDIGTASNTLDKLKTHHDKLSEVLKNLVQKNKQLEDNIKAQTIKIRSLESNIDRMKSEMKANKDSQEKTNKSLQGQIDELNKTLKASDSKVEQKMSSIVITVMAAHRFKNALKNHEGEKPATAKQEKLKPQ